MPLDVMNKIKDKDIQPTHIIKELEEQKNILLKNGNNELAESLSSIQQNINKSKKDLLVLIDIVNNLTSSGNSLSTCIQKVVSQFQKYKKITRQVNNETDTLIATYQKLGKSQSEIKKISDALNQVKYLQKELNTGFQIKFKGLDNVSVLTKQIVKLKNALGNISVNVSDTKNLPKFQTGGKVTGGSETGDKILARLNAGEWVFNKRQMDALGKLLSKDGRKLSHQQVFRLAGGNPNNRQVGIPMFASGGSVSTTKEFERRQRLNYNSRQSNFYKKQNISSLQQQINDVQILVDASVNQSQKKTAKQFQDLLKQLKSQYKSLNKQQVNTLDVDFTKLDTFESVQKAIQKIKDLKNIYQSLREEIDNFKTSSGSQIASVAYDELTKSKTMAQGSIQRKKTQQRAKSMISSAQTAEKIEKSGNKTAQKQLQVYKQSLLDPNATNEDIKLIQKNIRKLYSDLEKSQLQVSGFQNVFNILDKKVKKATEQFDQFFGGVPVGAAAAAAALMLVGKELYDLSKKITENIQKMSQMNLSMQTFVRTSQNAFGANSYIQSFRDNMVLTREQISKIVPTMSDFITNGNKGLQTMKTIASNIKQNFGTLDVSVFQKAMNLLKNMPQKQINVMMGINADSIDKLNTIANILQNGQLDATIQMYQKGAFGQVQGMMKLSEGDKRVLQSFKVIQKGLQDFKFGVFDSLGSLKPIVGIVSKFGPSVVAAGVNTIVSAIALKKLIMQTKVLSKADAGNSVRVTNVNGGSNGAGGKIGKLGKAGKIGGGIAIASGVALTLAELYSSAINKKISSLQQDITTKQSQLINKRESDIKNQGFADFGVTSIDFDKAQKAGEQARAATMETAKMYFGLAGVLGTGAAASAMTGAGAPVAAGLAGAAGASFAFGTYYAGQSTFDANSARNEQIKRQLGGDWKSSGMFKKDQSLDTTWNTILRTFGLGTKQDEMYFLDESSPIVKNQIQIAKIINKMKTQQKAQRKKMLQNLKFLRGIDAILNQVKNGSLSKFFDKTFDVTKQKIQVASAYGGSNQSVISGFDQMMKSASLSFSTNMQSINRARRKLFNDQSKDYQTKQNALNRLQQRQSEVIKNFVQRVQESVAQYQKIPGVILSQIKNKINKQYLQFNTKNLVGTSVQSNNLYSENVSRSISALKPVSQAIKKDRQNLGKVKEVTEQQKQKTISVIKSTNFNELGKKSGVDVSGIIEGNKIIQQKVATVFGKVQNELFLMQKSFSDRKLTGGDVEKKASYDQFKNLQSKVVQSRKNLKTDNEGNVTSESVSKIKQLIQSFQNEIGNAKKAANTEEQKKRINEKNNTLKNYLKTDNIKNALQSGKISDQMAKNILDAIGRNSVGVQGSFDFQSLSKEQKSKRKNLVNLQTVLSQALSVGDAQILNASSEGKINEKSLNLFKGVSQQMNTLVQSIDFNPSVVSLQQSLKSLQAFKEFSISANGITDYLKRQWQLQSQKLSEIDKAVLTTGKNLEQSTKQLQNEFQKSLVGTSQIVQKYAQLQMQLLKARKQMINNPTSKNIKNVKDIQSQVVSLENNQLVKNWKTSVGQQSMKLMGIASQSLIKYSQRIKQADSQWTKFIDGLIVDIQSIKKRSDIFKEQARINMSKSSVQLSTENFDFGKVSSSVKEMLNSNQVMYKKTIKEIINARKNQNKIINTKILEQQNKLASVIKKYGANSNEANKQQKKLSVLEDKKSSLNSMYQDQINKKQLQYKKQIVEFALKQRDAKKSAVDLSRQMIEVQKDLAVQIGAPYEQILKLQQQVVQSKRQALSIQLQALRTMKRKGATQKQMRNQMLVVEKARAQVIKAQMGAQRSAIEKLMGNVIGSWQKIGGIIGPQVKARMFGQGRIEGPDGFVIGRGANLGYKQRVMLANAGRGLDPYSRLRINAGGTAQKTTLKNIVSKSTIKSPKNTRNDYNGKEEKNKKENQSEQKNTSEVTSDILSYVKKISDVLSGENKDKFDLVTYIKRLNEVLPNKDKDQSTLLQIKKINHALSSGVVIIDHKQTTQYKQKKEKQEYEAAKREKIKELNSDNKELKNHYKLLQGQLIPQEMSKKNKSVRQQMKTTKQNIDENNKNIHDVRYGEHISVIDKKVKLLQLKYQKEKQKLQNMQSSKNGAYTTQQIKKQQNIVVENKERYERVKSVNRQAVYKPQIQNATNNFIQSKEQLRLVQQSRTSTKNQIEEQKQKYQMAKNKYEQIMSKYYGQGYSVQNVDISKAQVGNNTNKVNGTITVVLKSQDGKFKEQVVQVVLDNAGKIVQKGITQNNRTR